MKYTTLEIANRIGAELHGDPDIQISSLAPLCKAVEGSVSFLIDKRYSKHLASCEASAVVLPRHVEHGYSGAVLTVENMAQAQSKLTSLFASHSLRRGIHPTAVVADSAQISDSAYVGPYCVIEDSVVVGARSQILAHSILSRHVTVGEDCLIHPHVTCYSDVSIGHRCIIHSATVVGADGFGIVNDNGKWLKIAQIGAVVIGDDVEIGASCTIDRGAIENTVIHNGVKLDNQIHLGHNVEVGENTVMAGCTGIAGSTKIGKNCQFGGMVGVGGHLSICDSVSIAIRSFVNQSISLPGVYCSHLSAMPLKMWQRIAVTIKSLSSIHKRLVQLEKKNGSD